MFDFINKSNESSQSREASRPKFMQFLKRGQRLKVGTHDRTSPRNDFQLFTRNSAYSRKKYSLKNFGFTSCFPEIRENVVALRNSNRNCLIEWESPRVSCKTKKSAWIKAPIRSWSHPTWGDEIIREKWANQKVWQAHVIYINVSSCVWILSE